MSTSIKLNYGSEQEMLEIGCGLLNTWFRFRANNRHGNLEALARTEVNEWRFMIVAQELEGSPAVYWLYSWDNYDDKLPSYIEKHDLLVEAALSVALATVNIQAGHESERDDAMSWVISKMLGKRIWGAGRDSVGMVELNRRAIDECR